MAQYQNMQPDLDQIRLGLFEVVCRDYEINNDFALRLRNLEGYEIVVICDDSGSMNTPVTSPGSNAFSKLPTRWDELKNTVGIIVDIAAIMDHDGIDVYFLNRPPLLHITHHSQLDGSFNMKASGGTPIVPVLRSILQTKCEKKRLIILATDGCPNDEGGRDGITVFREVLANERGPFDFVTIVACTDEDAAIDYLNDWDKQIPHLDVVDDYHSERDEIIDVQGPRFKFSFGDYVVKALMGSIDPWFDSLDEVCITGYTTTPVPVVETYISTPAFVPTPQPMIPLTPPPAYVNVDPAAPPYVAGGQYKSKKHHKKKKHCTIV